jgi:hypothetical protein
LITLFQKQGQVEKLKQVSGGVEIQGSIPGRLIAYFSQYKKVSK